MKIGADVFLTVIDQEGDTEVMQGPLRMGPGNSIIHYRDTEVMQGPLRMGPGNSIIHQGSYRSGAIKFHDFSMTFP